MVNKQRLTDSRSDADRQVAFIALGSNIGDRPAWLKSAIEHLTEREHTSEHSSSATVELLACSAVYQTKPVGVLDQPLFLNMVIAVRTTLDAHGLFERMMAVEQLLGRIRDVHWGPRCIDLDLLWYGDEVIDSERLTVPHPHMYDRAFVLAPLLDVVRHIAPEKTAAIAARLETLPDKEDIERWMNIDWPTEFAPFAN